MKKRATTKMSKREIALLLLEFYTADVVDTDDIVEVGLEIHIQDDRVIRYVSEAQRAFAAKMMREFVRLSVDPDALDLPPDDGGDDDGGEGGAGSDEALVPLGVILDQLIEKGRRKPTPSTLDALRARRHEGFDEHTIEWTENE